jgi:hypothetical protein
MLANDDAVGYYQRAIRPLLDGLFAVPERGRPR